MRTLHAGLSAGSAAAVLLLVAFLSGCANPAMPTGGPPDETPPMLAESTPSPDEVRVSSDLQTVRLVFEDYIDEASFQQALSVTPPIDGSLEFSWRGTRVDISLPHALAENTTYIFSLDTDLRTWRNVNLNDPINIAFSTGDVIDQGEIAGRVIDEERGEPQEEYDIFAYPATEGAPPASLPDRPVYRTRTGSDGTFHLEYLSEEPFYVIAVRDQNRNRRPDPGEAFAAPPQPTIYADTAAAADDHTWIVAERDTIPPTLIRTQPRSTERTQFRFDEPLQLTSRSFDEWSLLDSVNVEERSIRDVYIVPDDLSALVVRSEALSSETHLLEIPEGAVADTAGIPLPSQTIRFTPSTSQDTVLTRFVNFLPRAGGTDPDTLTLQYGQRPGVRFNQPVDTTELQEMITVVDALDERVEFTINDRRAPNYRLDLNHEPGDVLRLQVDHRMQGTAPDSVLTRAYYRPSLEEVGEIAGRVELLEFESSVIVELRPLDAPASVGRQTVEVNDDGSFIFEHLPEGTYRLRAFVDRNQDGRWDPGSVVPYVPPAPLTWLDEPVRVRERWETTLDQPLRFDFAPAPPS